MLFNITTTLDSFASCFTSWSIWSWDLVIADFKSSWRRYFCWLSGRFQDNWMFLLDSIINNCIDNPSNHLLELFPFLWLQSSIPLWSLFLLPILEVFLSLPPGPLNFLHNPFIFPHLFLVIFLDFISVYSDSFFPPFPLFVHSLY